MPHDFSVSIRIIEPYINEDNAWNECNRCKTTTSSFPRKRESSLSNNLRVADKVVFEVVVPLRGDIC